MKTKIIETFKEKLNSEPVLGCFAKTTDSSVIESLALGGAEFIIIDSEHGYVSYETAKHHIMAAYEGGALPIVRVEGPNSESIGKFLDLDVGGVQVPSVRNKEQAKKVIENSKFYPTGNRGVCRFVRSADYGIMHKDDYFKYANEKLVILQIEGTEGIKNIYEIIEVKGIDIIFIGPYDLSQSLGIIGQIEHPKLIEEMIKINDFALKNNVTLGTFCDTIEQLKFWKDKSLKYLAYSVDLNILIEKMREIKNEI